ncbi:WYL domain-containing protein [Cellulophaga baltica]|nr:WYL domain-containing protein [Cellulophaga baltica]
MALNKNAIIRYKTIDKCLQDRDRKWTLEDLIKACSNALQTSDEQPQKVSKRTVQLDLQFMRDTEFGYNAPITVFDKKYYTYSDEAYTITTIPIVKNDEKVLSETVALLKQYHGFSFYPDLEDAIYTIENKVKALKDGNTSSLQSEGVEITEKNEDVTLSNIKLLVPKDSLSSLLEYPFHVSQTISNENEDGNVEVSLEAVLSPELEFKIMSFGNTVEVLEPESLRKKIVATITDLAKVYGIKQDKKAKAEKQVKTQKGAKPKAPEEQQQSLF